MPNEHLESLVTDFTGKQYELTPGGYLKGQVTVITPSIPNRKHLLDECMASVMQQTYPIYEHRIHVDYARDGVPAQVINRMLGTIKTEWIATLADDDLFLPEHIEKLIGASDGADMVYPWCKVTGRGAWNPNSHYDEKRLRTANYIPATVLIKTEAIHQLGGYPDGVVCEDHVMWVKMLDAGMTIKCLPEITWIYRFNVDESHNNVSDGKIVPWEV